MTRRTLALTFVLSAAALLRPVSGSAEETPSAPAPSPQPPPAAGTPSAAQPLKLRVLCFNLRYMNANDRDWRNWSARRAVAGKVITDDKPDLIGYQEALRPMLDELAPLAPGYEEIGVGRDDGKTQGEYSAIWVKKDRFTVQESGTFWLSDTPEIPGSKNWGNRIPRVCTWARLLDKPTGAVFHFYNLHLDHESQEARDKGTALVLKRMEGRAPAGPFVLTGDFNSGEDSSVVKAITGSHLAAVDSWRVLHPQTPAAESGTFHSFNGSRGGAKIDYIFVPKDTGLIDAEILHTREGEVYPSDHFPVRATVEFPPK